MSSEELILCLWSLGHPLLPAQISSDLGGGFAIKMLDIIPNMFVVRSPGNEMTKQQVMLSSLGFAQSDQVAWVKLQLWVEVEGFDVVDLHL